MERTRWLWTGLVLAAALAGCFGGSDGPAAAAEPQAKAQETVPRPPEPAATPSEAASSPMVLDIPGTIEQRPAVGLLCPKLEGGVGPCAAGRLVGTKVDVPRGAPAKATLAATWNASTPAGETLRLYWRTEAGEFEMASGSPLVAEIPPEMVSMEGEYTLAARPDVLGATMDEVVHFVLRLEYA